jgi:RNA recognition motif-containing protein
MNIYVSNLSFNVQDEDLRQFFTSFGEVSSAKIINDNTTGRSRGFGFVEMPDNAAAQTAITQLDQTTVEGRTMNVAQAKPREERPARNNSGSGYSDRNSGYKKSW